MLNTYTSALEAYHRAQSALRNGIRPGDPGHEDAVRTSEEAFKVLLRARKTYWDHVATHKCRIAMNSAAEISRTATD